MSLPSPRHEIARGSRPPGRIHVIGAGPVGLFLAALLQDIDGQEIRIYEQRDDYTRTRMVSLAGYLVADTIESYKEDSIDGQDVEAIFEAAQIEEGLRIRRAIAPDLRALLVEWTRGFVPLNTIERALSELIEARGTGTVKRAAALVDPEQALAIAEPGDILVDCTGARSVLRDLLLPPADPGTAGTPASNTQRYRLEYALVITFLYDQHYACNEYCKYYKNVENPDYKFIPAVHRTYYDGMISHVTGMIRISQEEYEAMPRSFDGAWLRERFPSVAASMDRFIDKVQAETNGQIIGGLDITRIPLDVYRARTMTSRRWHETHSDQALARTPVFLAGDSAIGSPYFQSISLGLECASWLARFLGDRSLSIEEVFDRYESLMYQQWLRVYMRTQMIKHNKDVLESVDDTLGLLAKLHVF